jgi:DNA-directed RNA polymerase specialized sigma24 family protein
MREVPGRGIDWALTYNVIHKALGAFRFSYHDREDVAQDVAVEVVRLGKTPADVTYWKGYVWRVAKSVGMKSIGKRMRGGLRGDLGPLPVDTPATLAEPLDYVCERLPRRQAQALRLRLQHGEDYAIICRELKCNYNAAKQLMKRARKRAAEILGDQAGNLWRKGVTASPNRVEE